ncbi:AMP-binding protein [Streptomyces sp. NPDC055006]
MQPNMIDTFRAVAAAVPRRECVVHRSVRRTYAELLDRVERLGARLADSGLGVHRERTGLAAWESGQDHLALYLHNGPEYLEGTLGALAARVAPLNVNFRYTATELRNLLNDARPAALIYHAAFAPVLAAALAQLRAKPVLLLQVEDGSHTPLLPGALDYEKALADAPLDLEPPSADADDLVLLYTGGTTGKPKGTMWRNGDMLHNLSGILYPPGTSPAAAATASAEAAPLRTLGSAPFMHGTGIWGALRAVLHGGLVAIPDTPHRLDTAEVCRLIERERLNFITLVGEAYCRPVADELERHTYDMSAVGTVLLGGVATSQETKARLLSLMPNAVMSESVGSSETMAVLNRRDASGGHTGEDRLFTALPRGGAVNVQQTCLLHPGKEEIGLLAAREPLPLGYLRDPDKTAETFLTVEGVRLAVPGDLVRLMADGRIELLGREATTINTGGEKVHGEEVERVLLAHPAVSDVVVVGRPSERWGQEIVAVLRLTSDTDDEALRAHTARELARYKLPKAFVRVAAIRRNPMGKPDYRWARELAARASGRPAAPTHTDRQH